MHNTCCLRTILCFFFVLLSFSPSRHDSNIFAERHSNNIMQVGIKHVACIRHDLQCTPYIHRHRRSVDNCGDDNEENRFVSRCLSGTLMEKVSSAESNFGLVTTIPHTHTQTHAHAYYVCFIFHHMLT